MTNAARRSSLARTAANWLLPGAGLVATAAYVLAERGRLPSTLVVHWDIHGRPNGSMPLGFTAVVLGGLYLYIWIGVLVFHRRLPVTGLRRRDLGPLARSAAGLATLGLIIGTTVAIVSSNAAVRAGGHAGLSWTPLLVGVVSGAAIGWLVGRALPPEPPRPAPRRVDPRSQEPDFTDAVEHLAQWIPERPPED